MNPGSVKNVTPVNDQVHFPLNCRGKSLPMIGEEVVPPPSPLNPRVQREVEAQVGVGHEKDSDGRLRLCPYWARGHRRTRDG